MQIISSIGGTCLCTDNELGSVPCWFKYWSGDGGGAISETNSVARIFDRKLAMLTDLVVSLGTSQLVSSTLELLVAGQRVMYRFPLDFYTIEGKASLRQCQIFFS